MGERDICFLCPVLIKILGACPSSVVEDPGSITSIVMILLSSLPSLILIFSLISLVFWKTTRSFNLAALQLICWHFAGVFTRIAEETGPISTPT